MFRRNLAIFLITLSTLLAAESARADLILLLNEDVLWNRGLESEPGRFIFSVASNSNPPDANQMNAFSVGIRVVRGAGSQGSLLVGEVHTPTTNRVFPNYATPPILIQQEEASFWTVSADNSIFSDVSIPATGLQLFELQLRSPTNDAVGEFLIYADRLTSNYFTTSEFEGLKFGNVPYDDQLPPDSGVLLGRIRVTVVPEPGSLLLLLGGVWVGQLFRRRASRNRSQQFAIDA